VQGKLDNIEKVNTMKFPRIDVSRVSRAMRVAIVTGVLVAIGAILFICGWHVTGIIVILIAAALLSVFYFLVVRPARLPADAVLTVRISEGMREDAPRSPLEQLRSRGNPTLYQLRRGLEAAALDPKLATVIAEISAPSIGLATAQELYDLLRSVRAANKRVVAVLAGDNVSVRDYLIACGASEIIINPDTALMMLGAAAGSLFLRNALGKIGVEAQTLQWKEYKGAAEMFNRETMSPEVRESLDAIVQDWKTIVAETVAAARKIDTSRARELLAQGFIGARSAIENGLIDRAGYIEDVRGEIASDPEDQERRFVGLARYLRHVAYARPAGRRARLALIHGLGPVVSGEPPMAGEFISGEGTASEILRASKDEKVRAIVFRVNSPGGSAVGSDLVWRAVREAQKRGKPVVVSMGDVAGSGGYYVAMGADAIVAEPSTITGSIGVVYTKFSLRKLLEYLGVGVDAVKTDEISDALSLSRPLSAEELAQLNRVVGELYGNFTAKVAEGRRLDPAQAEEIARGRVWSGVAARARGLIDEVGGLARAVEIAREKAGMKPEETYELVPYPGPSLISALNVSFARAGAGSGAQSEISLLREIGAELVGVPQRWLPALMRLLTRGGLMLLSPISR
jgi:protease-4